MKHHISISLNLKNKPILEFIGQHNDSHQKTEEARTMRITTTCIYNPATTDKHHIIEMYDSQSIRTYEILIFYNH